MLGTYSSCTSLSEMKMNWNMVTYLLHTGKLGASGVTNIINNNRSRVELFIYIVDNAFGRYNEDIQLNIDPFDHLDNDVVEEEIGNEEQSVDLEVWIWIVCQIFQKLWILKLKGMSLLQKQPSKGVLRKRCSENIQQIYRRTPMSKCDFNKFALQFALGCFPVNLLHIFRTPFLKNTSGRLLLLLSTTTVISSYLYTHSLHKFTKLNINFI